jgi:type I restriction enzyme S subunit
LAHLTQLDALFSSLQSRAFRGELWQHEARDPVGERFREQQK